MAVDKHAQTKQVNIKCSEFEKKIMDKKMDEARKLGFNGLGSLIKFLVINASITSEDGVIKIGQKL